MKIVLATLCLNEMEHLPRLVEQHRHWPGLEAWVFVEAADALYATSNSVLVSPQGLSTDGTTEFLSDLDCNNPNVFHVPFDGLVSSDNVAQNKCAMRNAYLKLADDFEPHWIVVLDADEFYSHSDQRWINRTLAVLPPHSNAALFKQRHIWRPPSIADEPLMASEVVGGYWAIPHTRVWRWVRGMRHTTNHNHPHSPLGHSLATSVTRFDRVLRELPNLPQCVHLGFASNYKTRAAKHSYYVARGEGAGDGREMYVDCRNAWEQWVPGEKLPHGADVIPYRGPIPEVLR